MQLCQVFANQVTYGQGRFTFACIYIPSLEGTWLLYVVISEHVFQNKNDAEVQNFCTGVCTHTRFLTGVTKYMCVICSQLQVYLKPDTFSTKWLLSQLNPYQVTSKALFLCVCGIIAKLNLYTTTYVPYSGFSMQTQIVAK